MMNRLPEGVTSVRVEGRTLYYKGPMTLSGAFEMAVPAGRWVSYSRGRELYVGRSREEAEAACIEAARGE
jgi:hypothetical protein